MNEPRSRLDAVLLLEGQAHGHTCQILRGRRDILVSMTDNGPIVFAGAAGQVGRQQLDHAARTWESYTRVDGLGPDPKGRIAFYCAQPHRNSRQPLEKPNPLLDDFLKGLETEMVVTADQNTWLWSELAGVLHTVGLGLSDL